MVFSVDKILTDLRNVPDYATFEKVKGYIHDHRSDFSPQDYEILMENVDEIEARKFNSNECSQIKNIYYMAKEGYRSREWIPLGMDQSMSICSDAKDLNIPLKEYLFMLYPDMATFKIETVRPSSYEKELAQGILPTMEQRYAEHKERRVSIRRESQTSPEEVHVGIDITDLMERQRSEMRELIEAARDENHAEMERLRENINALKTRLENASPSTTKRITRVLDTSQYNYFQRNAISIGLPITQRRIARGEYEVSIQVSNPDEEQKTLGFLADVEEHATVKESMGKIRPAGYEDVLRILCNKFESEMHMSCGLSKTGALSTLAERIIEYAASQGTEWDKLPLTPSEINLFPSGDVDKRLVREKRVYPSEIGHEAFNAYVRQIEGEKTASRFGIERNIEETEGESCSPEEISSYIVDFDAVTLLKHNNPEIKDPEIDRVFNDAVRGLTGCGYYPNGLQAARDESNMEFQHYGTSYNDQINAVVERYIHRYGIGS